MHNSIIIDSILITAFVLLSYTCFKQIRKLANPVLAVVGKGVSDLIIKHHKYMFITAFSPSLLLNLTICWRILDQLTIHGYSGINIYIMLALFSIVTLLPIALVTVCYLLLYYSRRMGA